MPNYMTVPLQDQVAKISLERQNVGPLQERAATWTAAAKEFPEVYREFLAATDKVKQAEWSDGAGAPFLANSEQTLNVLRDWEEKVTAADPGPQLAAIAKNIPVVYNAVQQVWTEYLAAIKQLEATGQLNGETMRQTELQYRAKAAQHMNGLAAIVTPTTMALQKILGAPEWRGNDAANPPVNPDGDTPGAQNATRTGGAANPAGNPDAQQMTGDQAGPSQPTAEQNAQNAPTGNTGSGPAAQQQDPSLSGGLGSAPAVPTVPAVPGVPTAPAVPGGGLPIIPPIGGAIGGTAAFGGGAPRGGGGGGRVPGVSVGGVGGAGSTSIPAVGPPAAQPVNTMPTGAPPSVQPVAGAGSAGGGGGGGMPPMMPPPMGAAGAGVGGGGGPGPGSGAAQRPGGPGRARRKDDRTPGLLAPLSGKAGKADPNAFATRGREHFADSDIPSTVQLIDEDLWQVEQPTPATADPVRRTH